MPVFVFESPSGQKYRIEGPKGSSRDEAAAELQRRIDTGEIAQMSVGTEKGRKTNTGNAEYSPLKQPKETTARQIGKTVGDVIKGSVELPVAVATGAAANLAGNLSGAAYEYLVNPAASALGKKDVAKAADVRTSIMKDYTYQPRSESGKASLGALGTLTTPIRIIGETASGVSEGLGGSEFTNAMIGDVAMATVPGQAVKGAKKVIGIAPEIAKAVAPVKAYDAAANAVYKAQKNARTNLRQATETLPPGTMRNLAAGAKKFVEATARDESAYAAAGASALSGNVPLAAAVLAGRQLRKRGAQNFAKSKNTATSELATTIKQDIASPEVNTYNTEAIGTIGSQNIDDLANSIKADITDIEE